MWRGLWAVVNMPWAMAPGWFVSGAAGGPTVSIFLYAWKGLTSVTSRYVGKHRADASGLRVSSGAKRAAAVAGVAGSLLAVGGAVSSAHASTGGQLPDQLVKIRYCESGGNYSAQNPTSSASGAYQFLDSTWRGLPAAQGYARAKYAPPAVQDAAALQLYRRAGSSPWLASKSCWGSMGATPATRTSWSGGASTSRSASRVPLTRQEQADLKRIDEKMRAQPWWSPQAANGNTVVRSVVTEQWVQVPTHASPSFGDGQGSAPVTLKAGDQVVGHYVNLDWFKVTSGPAAGRYVSSGVLHRAEYVPANGQIPGQNLCQVPSYLRAFTSSTNAYLGCEPLKQLIKMNAAARNQVGQGVTISEGYRNLATQRQYFASLPKGIAAKPGTSPHGLGVAVDFQGYKFKWGTSFDQWMASHASSFGWQRPDWFNKPSGKEYWHYNFIG